MNPLALMRAAQWVAAISTIIALALRAKEERK